MAEALLDVAPGVGAAGAGRELARRQGRRDGDHAHPRRLDLGPPRRAVGSDRGAVIVELLGRGHPVAEAQAHHLRRIGDRAAANRDDQIGAGLARRVGRGDDIAARGMRADLRANAGKAVAEHLPQPVDIIGLTSQGAARQHKDGARVEPVDLLRQRLGVGLPEDDAFHCRKPVGSAEHRIPPIFTAAADPVSAMTALPVDSAATPLPVAPNRGAGLPCATVSPITRPRPEP